jgi:hypothetical protein
VPKRPTDERIQAAAKAAIAKHGTVASAASALGMPSSTLWRAAETGCVIERNRRAILAGEPENQDKGHAVSSQFGPYFASPEDLRAARRVFQTMIQLIDNHMSRSAPHPTRLQAKGADTEDQEK